MLPLCGPIAAIAAPVRSGTPGGERAALNHVYKRTTSLNAVR